MKTKKYLIHLENKSKMIYKVAIKSTCKNSAIGKAVVMHPSVYLRVLKVEIINKQKGNKYER